ncbi:MAG: S41 family peptidase [Bacteroidales bacterium]|nr:S41 family peptidase [Bacteroidales bacterium]
MKRIAITLAALALAAASSISLDAQSKAFKLGQWTEIHNSIVKDLNMSYVDSLPVDRIMRAGIDAMLKELDPYTVYVPEEENEDFQYLIGKVYGGIGAIIYKPVGDGVYINEPYEGSPAQKYGLRCGDKILKIDGEDTKPLTSKEASDKMKGKPGTSVVFTIEKAISHEVVDVTVVRERIHLPDIEYAGMLNDHVGYIMQSGFTENVAESLKKSIIELKNQGMTHLVYDLRGNGGGLLQEAVKIVSLFVPRGTVVVTSKGINNDQSMSYKTSTEPLDTELPLTVLIDGGSASASEIVSGALQDLDRATIMGKRSYGKGLVQSIHPVAYNGQLKITTAKYYTPSGRCVQAREYGENGEPKFIPDSLAKEFKTAGGRIVKDCGGITPDVELEQKNYSRLAYAIVLGGICDNFALEYAKKHASIAPLADFHCDDAIWEEFVAYAMTQKFDYRSGAKALFDSMRKELAEDGLEESMKPQLDALEKALQTEKEDFIRMKKDELVPFIEEEIAIRYYYQKAGVQVRLRYDEQLEAALKKL